MASFSVTAKALAIKYLPLSTRQMVRRFMWNALGMQQGAARPLDLSVLQHLDKAAAASLRDPAFIRDRLLPRLGLNDEGFEQIPPELYEFCGKGLRCWQYPVQFSEYLVLLGRLGVQSYIEIGIRHGGTFILTVEYLRRFHPVTTAIAVDLGAWPSFEAYRARNPAAEFFQFNSRSEEFRQLVEARAPFDAALIDGDHSEEGCWQDFMLLKDKAAILTFHDIVSDVVPGVSAVWRKIRAEYAADYEFFEFADQYRSLHERTGKRFLGIGVAVRKDRLADGDGGANSAHGHINA